MAPDIALFIGIAVLTELRKACRIPSEIIETLAELAGKIMVERKTLPGKLDGRHHHLPAGHRPVSFEQRQQAVDGSRNARSLVRSPGQTLDNLAVFIQIHIAMRTGGRFLPVIQGHHLAVRQPHHGEPAAADIARGRISHGKRKTGGDRRVHGIAALPHDPHAGRRCICGPGSDKAIARVGRLGAGRKHRRRDKHQQQRNEFHRGSRIRVRRQA